mmetsp:Transcript_94474/g.147674  ORF Transcript_94474/g.147674 Transcript_94474/m.147674 type:complete len:418 (-) Transcript_94474:52-1305(-)
MRPTFIAVACLALACQGRRVQNKELFKSVSSSVPIDTEGVSSHRKDESAIPPPTDSSGLLLAQNPANAINRIGATQNVARSAASNMRGAEVLERGPEIATEEKVPTFNPYASKGFDRTRSKFSHSPQSSISVPAYGMPLPMEPATSRIEDDAVSNPKKVLRSGAVDIQDATSQSKRGWGRPIVAGIIAVFVVGVGIATRRKAASKEDDLERGDTHETAPLLSVAKVASPAKESRLPDDSAKPLLSVVKDAIPAKESGTPDDSMKVSTLQSVARDVSSDLVITRAEANAFTEAEKDIAGIAMPDQKKAADAKRAWMKMLRDERRARRQKRLSYLKAMKKMRLQRLKAERERMKRKMQTDFGIALDPGLEKRNAQDRNEGTVPQRGLEAKEPHRQLSLAMRLLRIAIRARKMRRVRRTR